MKYLEEYEEITGESAESIDFEIKPLTILLTSCGAQTSPSIIEALRNNGEQEVRIIGVDSNEEVPGKYLVDEFHKIPPSSEWNFIHDIVKICKYYDVNVIYPCGNEDVLAIENCRVLFDDINVKCITNDYDVLRNAFDKDRVYKICGDLSERNCPKFRTFTHWQRKELLNYVKELKYKCVIKPCHGKGGRGVYIMDYSWFDYNYANAFEVKPSAFIDIRTLEQFTINEDFRDLIVMEYLPGDIYSVYCLCDHGETLWTGINKRIYGNASNTLTGMTVQYREIEECVKILNKEFEFHYSVNYEFAEDENGVPKLFDLNPRSAASTGVFIQQGINLPWLTMKQALGIPLKNIPPAKVDSIFLRYLKELYV